MKLKSVFFLTHFNNMLKFWPFFNTTNKKTKYKRIKIRGTRFELDEQKASKLSGMSVEQMWEFINEIARQNNLIKIKNGEYHTKGQNDDESDMAIFVFDNLLEMSWFTKSTKSWIEFYDDGSIEDIKYCAKIENVGVWS